MLTAQGITKIKTYKRRTNTHQIKINHPSFNRMLDTEKKENAASDYTTLSTQNLITNSKHKTKLSQQ